MDLAVISLAYLPIESPNYPLAEQFNRFADVTYAAPPGLLVVGFGPAVDRRAGLLPLPYPIADWS